MMQNVFVAAAMVTLLTLAPACSDNKGQDPSAQVAQTRSEWAERFRDELERHAIDPDNGGVLGWLDRAGKPIPPGTKSLVQQARVVWSFAAAYRRYPNPTYRQIATHTLRFMRKRLADPEHRGFFWMTDRRGRVTNRMKHMYGQAFAIYALGEYARAFSDEQAEQEAFDLFDLVERKAHDAARGGYYEAFSSDWLPLSDPLPRGLGARGVKTLNTHIHILEALATLYALRSDDRVRDRIEELIDLFTTRIVDADCGYANHNFSEAWVPVAPGWTTYGHNIELSWLLVEAAESVGRADEPAVTRTSIALAEHTVRYGCDDDQGGVFAGGPIAGRAASRKKVWWVQAEALVGFLNAWQMTAEPKFWDAFDRQAHYVFDRFVDAEHGEWFNTIKSNGRIAGKKANEWKAPYHVARACLQVIRRLKD
jgi:mannobiose 2-epimerase